MRHRKSRSEFHIAVPIVGVFAAAGLVWLGWVLAALRGGIGPATRSSGQEAVVSWGLYILGALVLVASIAYVARHLHKRAR